MAEKDGVELRITVFPQFGAKTRKPLVAVVIHDEKPIFVSPQEARDWGMSLIASSYVSDVDAHLLRWLEDHMGVMDPDKRTAALVDFRRMRIEDAMPGGGPPQ